MQQVIIAFESRESCEKLRELVESSGEFTCALCQSGAQVKRLVGKLPATIVVCGFKLTDESGEALYGDLPQRCAMLMVAPQPRLELCGTDGVFRLPTPVRRAELLASLRILAQLTGRTRQPRPSRTEEERELVERAKGVLMDRHGMSEAQAHRFLQKESMDAGMKLGQTAQLIIEHG